MAHDETESLKRQLAWYKERSGALKQQAEELWKALAPFGKTMRNGDRERFDPDYAGREIVRVESPNGTDVVTERDMIRAALVWRQHWQGKGRAAPDDIHDLARLDDDERKVWERTGVFPWDGEAQPEPDAEF